MGNSDYSERKLAINQWDKGCLRALLETILPGNPMIQMWFISVRAKLTQKRRECKWRTALSELPEGLVKDERVLGITQRPAFSLKAASHCPGPYSCSYAVLTNLSLDIRPQSFENLMPAIRDVIITPAECFCVFRRYQIPNKHYALTVYTYL